MKIAQPQAAAEQLSALGPKRFLPRPLLHDWSLWPDNLSKVGRFRVHKIESD